jgi:2-polyprenyl-3-methyl-5-hydroxy-6-metoxy-1,4-benzoquinol methylase
MARKRESEMLEYSFDDHYVEALRYAMRRWETRNYVLERIDKSLHTLGLHENCVMAVISLITDLFRRKVSAIQLAEQVSTFQKDWRIHLDRRYLTEYETTRWRFMLDYVFGLAEPDNQYKLGRCLDVGCGRGCITASLYREKLASSIVGIDASDFTSEWNERLSDFEGRAIEFRSVPMGHVETWLQKAGPFDTIMLLYVLHHSEEHWAARTLEALKGSLSPKGRLFVLEDSLDLNGAPLSDNLGLTRMWRDWAYAKKPYCLTAAYDAQVILDFVAVQLLAGFWDVRMPCNYRKTDEWLSCFKLIGYEVERTKYIGFPERRDIDVPQALFVLKLPDRTGGRNADQMSRAI